VSQSTRVCVDCGVDISARHWRAQRCELCASERYRQQGAAKRTRTMYDHVCEWCISSFQSRVKHQRFCGNLCSGLASHPGNIEKQCAVCDTSFIISRQYERDTCSKPCTKWHYKRPDEKPPTQCFYCGGLVSRKSIGALYCSPRCNTLSNVAIRRARLLNLPTELISCFAIFERDNWICHLCGQAVSPDVPWPDLRSSSLDHIIPVSVPGCPGHVWVNVALAHLGCNMSKNNRVRPEDWSLYRELVSRSL
jgi:hypothetical protein